MTVSPCAVAPPAILYVAHVRVKPANKRKMGPGTSTKIK